MRRPLLLLSLLSGAIALTLRLTVFRHLSVDNDDGVYLLQAKALAHGDLRVPLGAYPDAQQPWFFTTSAHGYVSKYLPVAPALYALSLLVTGSVTPVLVALAAGLPLVTSALARRAGLTPRRALLAATVTTLSPAALVQGGLVLSYLPFLVLLVAAWTCLLGLPRTRDAAGFGLLAALAGCTRPFDTVLLLGPGVLWALARRPGLQATASAVAGAAPVVAAVLAFNAVVTGSALRLPFGLLQPQDKIGYGTRRLFPEDLPHAFGPLQALDGSWVHFVREPFSWFLAASVLLPLTLWAVRPAGRATTQVRLLVASGGVMLLGYLVFWGPWNVSVLWFGSSQVGPFYALPLLVPLSLAAACALPGLTGRRLAVALVAVLAALVPNVVTTQSALAADARNAGRLDTLLHVAAERGDKPLLLEVDPPYVGHPVAELVGRDVALTSQLPANALPAMAQAWELQLPEDPYTPGKRFSYALRHEQLLSAPLVVLDVSRAKAAANEVLVVQRGSVTTACTADAGHTVELSTNTTVSDCSGAALPARARRDAFRLCPTNTCLSVQYFSRSGQRVGWRRLPLGAQGRDVVALADGPYVTSRGGGWVSVTLRTTAASTTRPAAT